MDIASKEEYLADDYHYAGPKFPVQLVGLDGNVFSIIGRVLRAIGDSKELDIKEKEAIKAEYTERATAGDYNHALSVTMEYVDHDFIDEDDDEDDEDDYCIGCGNTFDECDCADYCPDCDEKWDSCDCEE